MAVTTPSNGTPTIESSEGTPGGTGNTVEYGPTSPVVPFTDMAAGVLGDGAQLWNFLPGVAIFDYDRDGDMDVYFTQMGGEPNLLYRNDGDMVFLEVGTQAGVTLMDRYSTGVVACDVDNDGFHDLYVGAAGNPEDDLDYRSPSETQGNKDALLRNNGDGTFTDVTDTAFGDGVNVRSASTIACADVDND
ncbi:MAG: VCBS repeat-containing protein, partial [Chloroflexi bacterium]|nr:VCBS repeat-containing protein [Chloroflexota bacterium]